MPYFLLPWSFVLCPLPAIPISHFTSATHLSFHHLQISSSTIIKMDLAHIHVSKVLSSQFISFVHLFLSFPLLSSPQQQKTRNLQYDPNIPPGSHKDTVPDSSGRRVSIMVLSFLFERIRGAHPCLASVIIIRNSSYEKEVQIWAPNNLR